MSNHSANTRRRKLRHLLITQGNLCPLCGGPLQRTDANLDHKIPRSFGGSDSIVNLQATHISCNTKKGGKLGMTIGMRHMENGQIDTKSTTEKAQDPPPWLYRRR